MEYRITKLQAVLFASVVLTAAPWAQADCTKVIATKTLSAAAISAGYTAKNWTGAFSASSAPISFGTIILGSGSESLEPAGSTLGSATVNFLSDGPSGGYAANQILFKCALSDANELFEMYAVNASTGTLNGKYETNDVPDAYVSPAKNIAFRIINLKTGLYYSNKWQQRQLTASDYYSDGKNIYVPASAFSDAVFELVKTDDTRYSFGTSRDAFGNSEQQGLIAFKVMGGLIGNTMTTGQLVSSLELASTPGEWSLRNGSTTIIRGATCVVGDYDQVVQLPPVSDGELRRGGASTNTFNVSINCDAGVVSGTTTNAASPPVAMGFLVTQPIALSKASALGLMSSAGGISYLLDDNYGNNSVASGVGIRILSPHGDALNLLSNKNALGTGPNAGWYGFADLLSYSTDTLTGGKQYSGVFTASLEQLPGLTATAGSVNAQAQIVVSLQ
ncbi:fimbrial usher protein StbD [Serratia plymuthica]|uniref:fimbrial usher protein StbD n=1 Tax=Serratia plymuthica TaxID=82996 RepID=UPI00390C8B12